jgi:hypothetical protein
MVDFFDNYCIILVDEVVKESQMRVHIYVLFCFIFSVFLPSAVSAEITITTKPSCIQQLFVHGEPYYACTSTGWLMRFLEQSQRAVDAQANIEGCGAVNMTTVTRRKDYVTVDGRRFEVYSFLVNGWDFYTYNQVGRRRRY